LILVDERHPHPGDAHLKFVARFHGLAQSSWSDLADLSFWSGDWAYGILVEVKKPQDLVESVEHSGRLIEQIRRAKLDPMAWVYYLVLERGKYCGPDADGDYAERTRGGFTKVAVPGTGHDGKPPRAVSYRRCMNFLNSLDVLEGVRLRLTASEAETVALVVSLYHWWQKPLEAHTSTTADRLYAPVWLGPSAQVSLLREWAKDLDGIGVKRSKDVEGHFTSALEMAEADVAEWVRVPGIGKATAEKVWRQIRNGRRQ